MVAKPTISERLVLVDPGSEVADAQDVIRLLCQLLLLNGYVEASYEESVLKREEEHPTGLPTLPYQVAIPHADSVGVHHTGLAVAVLKRPVRFRNMGDPERFTEARIVFLIAVAEAEKQVAMLQWLCTALQDQEMVRSLASATDAHSVVQVLKQVMDKEGDQG